MTITNGYCTLAEYKAWVAVRGLAGSVGTDASDDTVIEQIIEKASRFLDNATGHRFYKDASDTYYYFAGDSEYKTSLPEFASITTVSVDYNNTREYTDLTSGDYDILPDNYAPDGLPITGLEISPLSSAWFPTYRRGVKVLGKRGWPAVPDDIVVATMEIASSIYSERSGQTAAGKVEVTAAGVVIRPEAVPKSAEQTIKHYRERT